MRKAMIRLLPFLLVLFLAVPAHAGSWLKFCRSGSTTTGLSPGQSACYQPSSNSDDSVLLDVNACENVTVRYFTDRNGDATASTVSVTVRSCPLAFKAAGKAGDSDACWILENVTLDGDPSTNTEAIYGFDASMIYVDLPGSGTIADPQLDVDCNAGPGH